MIVSLGKIKVKFYTFGLSFSSSEDELMRDLSPSSSESTMEATLSYKAVSGTLEVRELRCDCGSYSVPITVVAPSSNVQSVFTLEIMESRFL